MSEQAYADVRVSSAILGERDKSVAAFIIVAAAVVVASLPFLGHNLIHVDCHDLLFHLARIRSIADGLAAGQFPVKLYDSMAWGYGYPAGVCYPDLFLYIPAVLMLAGIPLKYAYALFVIAMNAFVAGLAYACFKRMFSSRKVGVFCSVLWTLSIYRLCDIFVRTAVGEYMALAFLPLIALGVWHIFLRQSEGGRGWLALGLGMTGVFQSHILSVAIYGVVGLLVVVVLAISGASRTPGYSVRFCVVQTVKAVGLCIFLSLWFLVPFLDYYLTESLTVSSHSAVNPASHALDPMQLLMGFVPFAGQSVGLGHPLSEEMPLELGWSLVLALASAIAFLAMPSLRERLDRSSRIVLVLLLALALLLAWMCTCLFPWGPYKSGGIAGLVMSKVAVIQFPWRLLGVLSFILIVLAGLVARNVPVRAFAAVLMVLGMGIAFAEAGYATTSMAESNGYISAEDYDAVFNQTMPLMGNAEYVPIEAYEGGFNRKADDMPREPIANAPAVVDGWEHDSATLAQVTVRNDGNAPGTVRLPLLWYDEWGLYDSEGSPVTADSGASLRYDAGFVGLELAPGYSGTLVLKYVEPLSWRLAELISLAALIALIAFSILRRRRMKRGA